jgi:two-component system sensor kinase FixL
MLPNVEHNQKSCSCGLRGIIDGAQIPIVESDKDMIITSANSATEKVFGYAPDELLGRKVNVLMLPRDDLLHDGYIEEFNCTGVKMILSTVGRRVHGRRKDGSELTLLLTTSATLSGYAAVFVDLTEQIATECSLAAER